MLEWESIILVINSWIIPYPVVSYCLGGADPICYFPDPNSPREEREAVDKLWDEILTNKVVDIDDEEEDVVRKSRQDDTDNSTSSSTNITSSTEAPERNEILGNTFSWEPADDIVLMSDEKKMAHPKMKTYPSILSAEWVYAPWTYNGYYNPREWGIIPKWHFLPVIEKKVGHYTKTQLGHKSGLSFMNFKKISRPDPILIKAFMGKFSDRTNPVIPDDEVFWGGVSSKSCTNARFPSPLDIITLQTKENPDFTEFMFRNYDAAYSFIMFVPEDGTDLLYVKLQTPPKTVTTKPSIEKGAVLGETLYLDRILIHYGESKDKGSEHRIDGRSYAMELQFIFNKQDTAGEPPYWQTLENYMIDKDPNEYGHNLLILCVFVEVAPEEEKFAPGDKDYNEGLRYLADTAEYFSRLKNPQRFRSVATKKRVLKLEDFFKVPVQGHYYTYYGCLTYPPCLNNTRYSVFENPIYMSHDDWKNFLYIPSEFSDTAYLAGNYRPMERMTFTSNWTNTLVKYDQVAKVNLSRTVQKSRKMSDKERLSEYDYYEDQYD